LENFVKENQLDKNLFFTLLIKLGFDPDSFTKEMSSYSFGEKKKVLLARSLSQSADIYLWDEPLNYLDIEARVQIENLLVSSSPTMIFVEHDEAFRTKVATEVISLEQV
jgi:lincosamide and streptogramin A transport system ATP-binding/permease protein